MSIYKGTTLIAGALPNAANQDLSNLSQTGQAVIDGKANVDLTNATDQAKILIGGMAMPSDKYINLTLGASGSTYTAPADGFVTISKSTNGTNQWLYIHSKLWTQGGANPSGYSLEIFCPVTKGEQFTISYSAGGAVDIFRFYYAQGSESEAQ